IAFAPGWGARRMNSLPRPPAVFWREPSGDLTGRGTGGPICPIPQGLGRRVFLVQGDALNRSRIATVVCVPLTSNLRWAEAPGNVSLPARVTGLPKDSVANVSQIVALDKDLLTELTGKLQRALELLLTGIDVVLGR